MDNPAGAWLQSAAGEKSLIQGNCSIGRSAGNTVVLPDDRISRRHAMVHAQAGDEFWLVDLGSANGTYLNGRRVTQPCRLSDADEISVGSHKFTFHKPNSARASDCEHADKTIQEIKSVECWLLVADIEASTEFTRNLPPEEAPRVTGRWLAECKQAVDENLGAINKFLGDGFLAYWMARDDSAANVAKTIKSLKPLQDRGAPRFRIVLHRGKVFVGGGGSMGEESLLGNEVNFVFRMEKLAGSLGQLRLMSAPAADGMKKHLVLGEESRHGLQSFDGEFTFVAF